MSYYLRNNVEFRIVSCKEIGRFKDEQAFIFSEIISGKHIFSDPSKEALYLLYEHIFRWVLFIERLLIDSDNEISSSVQKICREEASVYYEGVSRLLRLNPDVFLPKFAKAFLLAHRYTVDLWQSRLYVPEVTNRTEYFRKAMAAVASFLNSTLFIVHEVDSLAFHSYVEPFLCVEPDDFVALPNEYGFISRCEIYKTEFNIDGDICLKSYVGARTSNEALERLALPLLHTIGLGISRIE